MSKLSGTWIRNVATVYAPTVAMDVFEISFGGIRLIPVEVLKTN